MSTLLYDNLCVCMYIYTLSLSLYIYNLPAGAPPKVGQVVGYFLGLFLSSNVKLLSFLTGHCNFHQSLNGINSV